MEWIIEFLIIWYIKLPIYVIGGITVLAMIFAPYLKAEPYTKGEDGRIIPNEKKGWYIGFTPGLAVILVKDDRPVMFIMNYQGHTLGVPKEDVSDLPDTLKAGKEYNVIPEDNYGITSIFPLPKWDIYMIPFFTVRYLWWLSKVIVFKTNSMIFAGPPPWRAPRIYKLDYLKLEKGEIVQSSGYSNHLRVMPFDVFVIVPIVETRDNVKMKVTIHIIAKVTNPWLAAFAVSPGESWYTRISSLTQGIARNFYMSKTYQETLMSEHKTELSDALIALGDQEKLKESLARGAESLNFKSESGVPILREIGMYLEYAAIYDQDILDPKLAEALSAVAKAEADAKSRTTQAEAEAEATKRITEAIKTEEGKMVYQRESTIRTVQAAPEGAIVSINTSGKDNKDEEADTIRKAILLETKNRNKSG
ncbi:MAG: hypothetical protein H6779_04710 [Candidatus Nomurabacteria bacterium]|nr:hypothetical protein [Candidatus Nomurabacteria bacterium]USN87675.1 MAG: hypothetical protein H6779_04710 [Candidatus Nomurabacteria bacterium]